MAKPGLRLQILLLLGGLLLITFVPLFYAVTAYSNLALSQLEAQHSRLLGKLVAQHVAAASELSGSAELEQRLTGLLGVGGMLAIGVYDGSGALLAAAGTGGPRSLLPASAPAPGGSREGRWREIPLGEADALWGALTVGSSTVVLLLEPASGRSQGALAQLVGLYMGLLALALLTFSYFALTRLIVRPLDELSQSAKRVALGARKLHAPGGPRELVELGHSLTTMTERLINEETALRHKVEEIEEATRNLQRAQHSLVRSERLASVGRLAAGLAHEVGNPIAAMIGMQDLLLGGDMSQEEERDFIRRMRDETERINRILSDLLQFARPGQPGKEPGSADPGDVMLAITDTVTLVKPQRDMQGTELRVECEPDLPLVTLGREQLVQVVLNLVLNAVDAGAQQIRLSAQHEAQSVVITVEDDGGGVDGSVRDQLFEPFVTTKEIGKGTGLGLSVCRGLVEAAGGSISLDTEFTQGTRFIVELPAHERTRIEAPSAHSG